MSDIRLNTAVSTHFLDKLVRLARARPVTATQEIVDMHGVTLVARGNHLGDEHFDVLRGAKLKKTIESSLRVDDAVDTGLVVSTAKRVLDTSAPINRILLATGGGGATPLAHLARIEFSEPMRMLLTLAQHDNPHALEHGISVSLLSLCMARKLKLSDDEQHVAVLAGLLHDIGELYIAPAWLEPGKRLLPREWAHLVNHPRLGQILVSELASYPPAVGRAVAEHHERSNGTGYPRQSSGKHISAPGQAVAVAEMIAGVLGKDNPLERAELALKLVPGEHARELVSAISGALKLESNYHAAAHDETLGREDTRRLFRRICAVLDLGEEMVDGPGAKSPHSRELLEQALERILTIQRAFVSTGLDAYLNANHGLVEAPDGKLMFEKAVATREIQWRLRDIARDLALHTARSPDEKMVFASLIELLDDDSDRALTHEAQVAVPKLAALSQKSFAGSLPYAS
ncbi:HD-GYP domain-containing protein [Massilia sp. TWR1-2-2]|uniref:HD-GYP domain-containing protein n=1 Tax=Massilia sp. TWR1-2-2 TaxID=2804584 RepID=UPI003CE88831